MLILGLTGGIACGKSTVSRLLETRGAKVIDADKIAHEAMSPGTNVWRGIVGYFGKGVLNKDLSINREKLGRIIFTGESKRRKLEEIVHPVVIETINKKIKELSTLSAKGRSASGGNIKPSTILVLDVPLLIEADLTYLVDKLIVVSAWRRTQMRRLKKTGLKEKEVIKRIDSQLSLTEKVKLADYVVRNNGGMEELEKQVEKLWKDVLAEIDTDR